MRSAVAAVWAVVLCAFFLQAGNGLQTDLIGLTAESAFSPAVTGMMLASYYVGFSLAPLAGRAVIGRIGHVAAVAVSMLLAAGVIVAMPFDVNAPAWSAYRAVSGFTLSLTYIAIESWINDSVPNAVRGRAFSIYIFAQMVGMTLAQILLGMGRPGHDGPFVLAGFLLALAGVPVLLGRNSAPSGIPPAPLGIAALFRLSPVGSIAVVLSGVAWSILFAFGPVYAKRAGFDIAGVGLFMGLAVAAGGLVQIPAGWVSDIAGRRPVLTGIFAAGLFACLLGLVDGNAAVSLVAAALTGGFVFPIYAIAAAEVNDGISQEIRVAAAGVLILLFGIGSIFGPLLCGWAIQASGLPGFYGLLAVTMAAGLVVCAAVKAPGMHAPRS